MFQGYQLSALSTDDGLFQLRYAEVSVGSQMCSGNVYYGYFIFSTDGRARTNTSHVRCAPGMLCLTNGSDQGCCGVSRAPELISLCLFWSIRKKIGIWRVCETCVLCSEPTHHQLTLCAMPMRRNNRAAYQTCTKVFRLRLEPAAASGGSQQPRDRISRIRYHALRTGRANPWSLQWLPPSIAAMASRALLAAIASLAFSSAVVAG